MGRGHGSHPHASCRAYPLMEKREAVTGHCRRQGMPPCMQVGNVQGAGKPGRKSAAHRTQSNWLAAAWQSGPMRNRRASSCLPCVANSDEGGIRLHPTCLCQLPCPCRRQDAAGLLMKHSRRLHRVHLRHELRLFSLLQYGSCRTALGMQLRHLLIGLALAVVRGNKLVLQRDWRQPSQRCHYRSLGSSSTCSARSSQRGRGSLICEAQPVLVGWVP